jgi:hypothetical protein
LAVSVLIILALIVGLVRKYARWKESRERRDETVQAVQNVQKVQVVGNQALNIGLHVQTETWNKIVMVKEQASLTPDHTRRNFLIGFDTAGRLPSSSLPSALPYSTTR